MVVICGTYGLNGKITVEQLPKKYVGHLSVGCRAT